MTYKKTRRLIDISKIYQRGKTQIPSEVRKILNLKDGDKLLWYEEENGKITVEKVI